MYIFKIPVYFIQIPYFKIGILHSSHLNKNFVLEISTKRGMINIQKSREDTNNFHVASLGHHDFTARSESLVPASTRSNQSQEIELGETNRKEG